ncbi:class I SAM-dependent methyltransferase [Myroides odoratimimus]|uniref:SAM-dependent methyltransferase n=1 Tax=Myroides odoratimimus TaxID=76832 RepID=UPI00046A9E10|nr:SAM-dependent methyltransferase [Myroides odoratimimus]MCA4807493.1 SAM-dependent methyltransferase [Myroides odoratimimus]
MFDKEFWEKKYANSEAQWNAGSITTPIKEYIDQLTKKDLAILVPGIGHGHELMYLYENDFTNISGLDFTIVGALEAYGLMNNFPYGDVILEDFFEHEGQYDLIIEQTFFCSLPINKRSDYVEKMHDLLKPGGKLVGVLFDCYFNQETPPFGGNKEEYLEMFKEKFNIQVLETAHNSIKPRAGRELFFIINKQHD